MVQKENDSRSTLKIEKPSAATPSPVETQLFVLDGKQETRTVPLLGETTLGRFPDNSIVINSKGVSRHHAKIYPSDGGFVVEDLGSSNGTLLNRIPLRPNAPQRLSNGDTIVLHDTLIVFVDTKRRKLGTISVSISSDELVEIKEEAESLRKMYESFIARRHGA